MTDAASAPAADSRSKAEARRDSGAGGLRSGISWNVASLAVMGLSGVALNVLIGWFYDAATLGVFNQVFAAYIIASQFAAGGVHLSVLTAVARHSDEPQRCAAIIRSGLWLNALLAVASCAVFWLIREPVAAIWNSPDIATGIALATPGLFFFAVNKVLLAVLNGFQRMRAFAIGQGMRYILMIAALVGATIMGSPGRSLAVIFSIAEGLLLLGLAAAVLPHLARPLREQIAPWWREHFRFGVRSVGGGVLGELNTRVDVLMLGYFAGDALVGVYSFAAILAEGFLQLAIVIRNNFNPILAKLLAARRLDELRTFIVAGKRKSYLAMSAVCAAATLAFPLAVMLLTNKEALGWRNSWPIFAILMAGVAASSGYQPFSQILLQGGRPGWQTILVTCTVGFNALLNALLIPLMSANGAAAATAMSYVFSVAMLRWLVRRELDVIV